METKIKAVAAITKVDIQVGRIASRKRKHSDAVSRMNAEYKDFKTVPAGTIVVIREGWTGADGEDRIYLHGKGWFKTDKKNGITLDSVLALKNSRATLETLFPKHHRYENLESNVDKLKTLVAAVNKDELDLDEKEQQILTFFAAGASIKEVAEKVGYAESTTREKLFGRRRNGELIPGIFQKLENKVV